MDLPGHAGLVTYENLPIVSLLLLLLFSNSIIIIGQRFSLAELPHVVD